MATLTQPIKWHGGKHYLADWIISHFPAHTHYVEPFAGGLSVLLRKDPEGVSEVVNDLNRRLTEFWTVLQSDALFQGLVRTVESVPFSEHEFTLAATEHDMGPVHNAANFFIRARQSRQGLMKDFATLSRNRTRRGMNEQVSSWLTAIDGLPEVHARLKRVAILNRPAVEVIRQQDGPNTMFYLDPPYLHETRVTTSDYAHEMTREQHEELMDALTGIRGKFALSGYHSELYDEWGRGAGWKCAEREIDNKASSKKTKSKKIECLWMNYERTTR
jgi:DNA adenine methylase